MSYNGVNIDIGMVYLVGIVVGFVGGFTAGLVLASIDWTK